MSELTPQQEKAMATFKDSIHLPGGGFHVLIIELCKEFQLPFQTVRSVLKKSQSSIEAKIRDELTCVDDGDLTKENWLDVIKGTLKELAVNNKPVMESLIASDTYLQAIARMEQTILSESDQEDILNNLAQAYEDEVCKPLMAMLYTTTLYWELSNELFEMTEVRRQRFSDYPQHMEATAHLLQLAEQVKRQSN